MGLRACLEALKKKCPGKMLQNNFYNAFIPIYEYIQKDATLLTYLLHGAESFLRS